jgi:hypothetical protein
MFFAEVAGIADRIHLMKIPLYENTALRKYRFELYLKATILQL